MRIDTQKIDKHLSTFTDKEKAYLIFQKPGKEWDEAREYIKTKGFHVERRDEIKPPKFGLKAYVIIKL